MTINIYLSFKIIEKKTNSKMWKKYGKHMQFFKWKLNFEYYIMYNIYKNTVLGYLTTYRKITDIFMYIYPRLKEKFLS